MYSDKLRGRILAAKGLNSSELNSKERLGMVHRYPNLQNMAIIYCLTDK